MKNKRKMRLKRVSFHPITTYILLIGITIFLSFIFSKLNLQATYLKINETTNNLEQTIVNIENLLNYDGIKYIFSNAAKNFISFVPLSMLLISAIGISIAYSTGLIETLCKRYLKKIDNYKMTFLIIFLATISTLINEIGYVILIPLAATIFLERGRNPLLGITASFAGVAFASGVSVFVGSMEVSLIPYTTLAARVLDPTYHISLTSNLFIMIVFSIVLSIVGTIVIEKICNPRLGKYKFDTKEKKNDIEIFEIEETEQAKLAADFKEKKGTKYALVAGIAIVLFFVYMIIPSLPGSGMLLDMQEKTYLNQLFGQNSYFQDGFTYMISLFFLITGIAYGIGAKTIKNDRDIINGSSEELKKISSLVALVFFASQFIAIFKKTNLATIITSWISNIIDSIPFGGIPLVIISVVLIAIANIFLTTPQAKWIIISSVLVNPLMASNISPQFAQFLLRAGDSMTDGITPLLAFFVIYVGYLNIYNKEKNPITITDAIKNIMPYCLIISITWILLILGWYLLGLPIGPNVFPTI